MTPGSGDFAKMLTYLRRGGRGGTGRTSLRRWGREEESLCRLRFSVSITQLGDRFRKEPGAEEWSGLASLGIIGL